MRRNPVIIIVGAIHVLESYQIVPSAELRWLLPSAAEKRIDTVKYSLVLYSKG